MKHKRLARRALSAFCFGLMLASMVMMSKQDGIMETLALMFVLINAVQCVLFWPSDSMNA